MAFNKNSFKPPFQSILVDAKGLLSSVWLQFFQFITNVLQYVGEEIPFELVNNQSSAANITPLTLDKSYVSAAFVEYLIQRITSSTAVVTAGMLRITYNPDTNAWALAEYGTAGPSSSGVTFSITSAGQVQYTSSNLAGTQEISRIVYRMRPIAAKHYTYSRA